MERFAHLSVNWCFSASIGSFQGLRAEASEVILLSQRLALKYNTTPRGTCQHFLTSFFQFLCGGGLGAKLQPQRTLSGIAARCLIPPFVTYGDIFPPAGGNLSSQGGAFLHLTVSTKAFPQEIILLNFGIAECLWAFRYPFFTAGMQRETAVEQPAFLF